MMRGLEPMEEKGLRQIQSRWPQSHIRKGKHGEGLVTVPGFRLPPGWTSEGNSADICTILFIKPCGFPAARPEHFFVDIDLRLKNLAYAKCSRPQSEIYGFENWKMTTWFSWHLQMWDPNMSSLYTYLMVIKQRLDMAY